jgi:hypothetical protein
MDNAPIWCMPVDPLTAAVRHALRQAPCSVRALAREAGVPHSTLVRIQGGALNASPAVAGAIAQALLAWGQRCEALAAQVGDAANPRAKGD